MTTELFLEKLEPKVSKITYLSISRMLKKLYKPDIDLDENDTKTTLSNYPLYLRYLNDFAGTIYKQYYSSIDEIYYETCQALDIESDNKFLFDYRLARLELNDFSRIMSIENDDIKVQTIQKQYDEFEKILNSKYYITNMDKHKENIQKLEKNFELLKKVVFID